MAVLQIWLDRFWQDVQPTHGRLSKTLRIVLASSVTLILLMTLRVPAGALALYIIFLLARETPAGSLRSGIVLLLSVSISVAAQLAVVIATDNNPIARVLSVALIGFLGGMVISSTALPSVGTILGFIFCTGIANWELHRPAETLVRASLWLVSSSALSIGCAVIVEYAFGSTNPTKRLEQQLQMRYAALERLYHSIASGAAAEDMSAAIIQVSQLAAAGQRGMQELYNAIIERNMEAGDLPTNVHITMLAQLMDLSAAFGSQPDLVGDAPIRERCAYIAEQCQDLKTFHFTASQQSADVRTDPPRTLLDRIEAVVHNLQSIPTSIRRASDRELVDVSSKRVPLLVPNAIRNPDNIAFALKLSLCAAICYVFYHAVDWKGISTCVTTVFVTALSTRGAIHQKLAQRVLGCIIGGLILAIGATAFLFPHMDSITSLVVLVASVSFLAAWCATGRRFSYVGLQIAVAFYLVTFEGFGPSTELAPARDRFVGIVVGLIVMWIVFCEIWPIPTLTVMQRKLSSVVRNTAALLTLGNSGRTRDEDIRHADALRDQVGKTVAELGTLNDAAEFEFGSERQHEIDADHAILRAAFAAVAIFWNELAFFHSGDHENRDPLLIEMRRALAAELDHLAETLVHDDASWSAPDCGFPHPDLFQQPIYGDYVRNTRDRFHELVSIISSLNILSRTIELCAVGRQAS